MIILLLLLMLFHLSNFCLIKFVLVLPWCVFFNNNIIIYYMITDDEKGINVNYYSPLLVSELYSLRDPCLLFDYHSYSGKIIKVVDILSIISYGLLTNQ